MRNFKYDETLDRLNELPDSIILQILSFLDMRDVVRTTVISKRWENLWTSIPCLAFDELNNDEVETRDFVSRVLMLWKGAKIQKFKVDISENGFPELDNDIDVWMRFVSERSVEELCLHVPEIESEEYVLPQFMFSCSSITNLSLIGCDFEACRDVHWHHLKSLTLRVYSVSEDTINRVFSGSPQLEIFDLTITSDGKENLSIRSSSLKRLSVTCFLDYGYTISEISKYAMLTICAPNLEALVFSGLQYSSYLMEDVSSLTDATLDYSRENTDDLLRETLRKILPAFQHVEVITFSWWSFKVLGVIEAKYLPSPLLNVKQVRFRHGGTSLATVGSNGTNIACVGTKFAASDVLWDQFCNFLFPKLKKLDIDWESRGSMQVIGMLHSSKENIIKTSMMPLRIVEIGWQAYETSIFQFVEFFLNHATMLEKMVIQKRGTEDAEFKDMIMAGEKLLRLQRSFPAVEIIFCTKW